jgi:hypothetical protein
MALLRLFEHRAGNLSGSSPRLFCKSFDKRCVPALGAAAELEIKEYRWFESAHRESILEPAQHQWMD